MVVGGLVVWFIERRVVREFSDEELEQGAFEYVREYFEFIGHEHDAVQEFRRLTEARDLDGLRKRWRKISRQFERLERAAGHTGRPLILDYYGIYRAVLSEHSRRRH